MTEGTQRYSHELVELGNQAWILNCALAELYRFSVQTEAAAAASPLLHQSLHQSLQQQLLPARARLQTRLQALMSKWCQRMAEQSGVVPRVTARPWGVSVDVPDQLRAELQRIALPAMNLAQARDYAAQHPELFLLVWGAPQPNSDPIDERQPLSILGISGADHRSRQLWWSWCWESEWPLCRHGALADNLWQIDGCGEEWRALPGPTRRTGSE